MCKLLRIVVALLVLINVLVPGVTILAQPSNNATLIVESDPSQAQVFLDNASKGLTPASIVTTAGTHTLIVRKDGCRDVIMFVTLKKDETRKVTARLVCASARASLFVQTNPTGAQVYLNGQLRAVSTPATLQVDPGNYSVLLRRTNCQDFVTNVSVNAGEQRQISANLVCMSTPTPPIFPPTTPPTPTQNPVAQVAAQSQAILPTDPRFAALQAQFYHSLGMDAQGLAARMQSQASASAPQGLLPQPSQGSQGTNFNLFPEYQNVDLNQLVLQQGQTVLLGTIAMPANATLNGTPVPAGVYGVAAMDAGAAGMMMDSASAEAFHGGFVIVLIHFGTGSPFCFFFFPTISFFPFFFPIFSPVFVFQIIIQVVFPFPFFFPVFPVFPFPTASCPALPFVTPFSVTVGGPADTILATPAFTITEVGFSASGGALVQVQSLGAALSVHAVGNFSSQFVTVFPFSSITFNVISTSFVLRVDGGGKTGCVSATRSPITISGQASNN
jgi:hypothetical protein